MQTTLDFTTQFTEKAQAVSTIVTRITSMQEAFCYAVTLCQEKRKTKTTVADKGQGTVAIQGNRPIIAAPFLPADDFAILAKCCTESDIQLVSKNLRSYLYGVDVGCTYADFGIADTGTLVINSTSEDLRLSTMICETHLAILPISRICKNNLELIPELGRSFSDPKNYTAFITGPSRTADIERVLAIGVHGPLELHILLVEDTPCQ